MWRAPLPLLAQMMVSCAWAHANRDNAGRGVPCVPAQWGVYSAGGRALATRNKPSEDHAAHRIGACKRLTARCNDVAPCRLALRHVVSDGVHQLTKQIFRKHSRLRCVMESTSLQGAVRMLSRRVRYAPVLVSVGFRGLLHAQLEGEAGEGFLRGVTAEPRPPFFGNPASSFHPRFTLWCPLKRVFVFHELILA